GHDSQQRHGHGVGVGQLEHPETDAQAKQRTRELLVHTRGDTQAGVGRAVGRKAGERRAHRVKTARQASAQVLVALRVTPQLDEQAKRVWLLAQALHPTVAAGERALPGRARSIEQLELFGDLSRQMLLQQREQQVLLAAEVSVYSALGE